MPSYTQYKRFMACLDEDDPDIVGWFTTENGVHIPLKRGQNKKEAAESFFANKKGETAPVKSGEHWSDERRHFGNLIERPQKQMRELYHHLMYALPANFKNGEPWTLDIPQMETIEDFEKFHNEMKRRYEAGDFQQSDWAAGNMKRYLEQAEPIIEQTKGYAKSYSQTEARFEPKSGDNIDSEGKALKPEIKAKLEGSKAVDANGNPVVLYIGTRDPVVENKFDFKHRREDSVSKQRAIFATTKEEVAGTYKEDGGEVKKVYMNMQRPMVVDFKGGTFHNGGYEEFWVHPYGEPWHATKIQRKSQFADAAEAPVINKLVNYAKKNGYDGLIAKNIVDWGMNYDREKFDPYSTMWFHNDDYVVFDPNQIIVDE